MLSTLCKSKQVIIDQLLVSSTWDTSSGLLGEINVRIGSDSENLAFQLSGIMKRPYNHVKASLVLHAVIIVNLLIVYYPCGGVGATYGVVCLLSSSRATWPSLWVLIF